ncbi:hypothetical protein ACTGJ9_018475 [Bradyrhizobium sp. RDM12]
METVSAMRGIPRGYVWIRPFDSTALQIVQVGGCAWQGGMTHSTMMEKA